MLHRQPYHRATLMTQTLRRIQRRIRRMTLRRILLTILPMEEEEEEFSGDDADDDDEEEDDNEEKEEHLAPADSSTIPIDDLIPLAEETELFETDESAPTPPRLRRARISVRPQTPISIATRALIVAVVAALPSSSPPSPLTPLSSPLPQILSPPLPLPSLPLPLHAQ
ncbi:hypothetical protein Tco_0794710 [Tanacetum coccineum]